MDVRFRTIAGGGSLKMDCMIQCLVSPRDVVEVVAMQSQAKLVVAFCKRSAMGGRISSMCCLFERQRLDKCCISGLQRISHSVKVGLFICICNQVVGKRTVEVYLGSTGVSYGDYDGIIPPDGVNRFHPHYMPAKKKRRAIAAQGVSKVRPTGMHSVHPARSPMRQNASQPCEVSGIAIDRGNERCICVLRRLFEASDRTTVNLAAKRNCFRKITGSFIVHPASDKDGAVCVEDSRKAMLVLVVIDAE